MKESRRIAFRKAKLCKVWGKQTSQKLLSGTLVLSQKSWSDCRQPWCERLKKQQQQQSRASDVVQQER